MAASFLGWAIGFGSGLLSRIVFKFAVEQAASAKNKQSPKFWWLFLLKFVLVGGGLFLGVRSFSDGASLILAGFGIGLLMGVLCPIGIFSSKD